jgi:50S ribosomal subunit-associated GTPase HflX
MLLDPNETWDEEKAMAFLSGITENNPNTVLISAEKKWGLKHLMLSIQNQISNTSKQDQPMLVSQAPIP